MSNDTPVDESDRFINLIAEGLAYVNEVREVQPKRSKPFTSVRLSAMHGRKGELEYTKFDLVCRGREACELMKRHADAVNAKDGGGKRRNKVVARFRAGDLYADKWLFQGKPQACIKGRLILVTYLAINGEVVFHQPRDEQAEGDNPLPGEVAASNGGNDGAAEVADIVELRKDDPEFVARKEQLKGGGYRFQRRFRHGETDYQNVWVKFAA
ncbi:DUF3577 domain-containing protein [Endothiovibrio diazotrophicus]